MRKFEIQRWDIEGSEGYIGGEYSVSIGGILVWGNYCRQNDDESLSITVNVGNTSQIVSERVKTYLDDMISQEV